jgi:AraC-like DNA-binding protein
LSEQVQAALAAAESAVSQGVRLVHATAGQPTESPLAALQRELGTRLEEKPDALPARFDRYLEAVGARCGFRLDPARAYLEAGFVRVAESLRESGALDERSLAGLTSELDRTAADAATVNELFVAYRRALGDVAEAIAKPRAPAADRSLRRAEEYMRKHYAEALSLARVARVAGFSPTYFSELFRKRQGITFERHLVSLRIERAKQLLSGTGLNLERVARLSGLSTRTYLGRVFKRFAGETPMQYRRRVLEGLRVGNATRAEPAAMPKKRQHGS